MTSNGYVFAGAIFAIGLAATACGGNSGTTATVTQTVSASSSATSAASSSSSPSSSSSSSTESSTSAAASGDVKSLIPTPANTSRTDGPDSIHDSGTHVHFAVNGSPTDVMNAYKTALEGQGWQLTVERSGGGGATYTGTHGDAYGVFTGGGYGSNTDINSCAWPSKPSNTKCGDDN